MQATAQTDTVSPVTAAELADFLGVASTDPLLPAMLVAATNAVITHINQDLLQREWVGIVPQPERARDNLSPALDPSYTFELPYTALVSVDAVIGNGDESLDFWVQGQRRPAKVTVPTWDRQSELRIEYTAGMQSVPVAIKTGIMMLAAYLYEHRGMCDAMDGINKSGAAMLLKPYRVMVAV